MGEKTHEDAKGGNGKKREPDFHLQITESEEEMAQMLDWVLEGALRLMERGGFSEKLPDAVLALAEQNRMESDTTMAYMADRDASYDSGVCTDKTAIYADYRQYVLEELGKKPVNAEDFWKRVREKFPEAGIYQISHGARSLAWPRFELRGSNHCGTWQIWKRLFEPVPQQPFAVRWLAERLGPNAVNRGRKQWSNLKSRP